MKCGAPLTSYAATGPIESIYAEGHALRAATQHPNSLIVVVGIWLFFGPLALVGIALIVNGLNNDWMITLQGVFALGISLVLLWKTTRSYLRRPPVEQQDEPQNPS